MKSIDMMVRRDVFLQLNPVMNSWAKQMLSHLLKF